MNSIIIADTHSICREALCDYIRNALPEISIEAVSDAAALNRRMDRGAIALLLVDYAIYGRMMDKSAGDEKICLLLGDERPAAKNIDGVFYRTMSCKAMLEGIEKVMAGEDFFPAPLMHEDVLIQSSAPASAKPAHFHLTPREQEVLSYLVKGASNKEIARALDLQVVTVKLHVRGICRKLNASNRTQAALIAKENGWN